MATIYFYADDFPYVIMNTEGELMKIMHPGDKAAIEIDGEYEFQLYDLQTYREISHGVKPLIVHAPIKCDGHKDMLITAMPGLFSDIMPSIREL